MDDKQPMQPDESAIASDSPQPDTKATTREILELVSQSDRETCMYLSRLQVPIQG